MSANKYTIKAVEAILTCDLGVSPTIRENITKQLAKETDLDISCGEIEAARILDISQTTLYNWRKGKWLKAPHPFWFRIWFTLASEVRYDREQLKAYRELLKAKSTIADEPPIITENEVTTFIQLAENGI
ncbi:MAG: helix-turn-helix domain-containing protein [Victivallales bacterium]|nr:helix-turn-helix domain-containing protein [Victivallales bacterium]